ncbi:MAG: HAMP domain-containing sensor histidine kinase [Bacteroidetes bacterium]|nr:HAMP domain-containing sensor histidine kinase [Bacteroidota bacterium]
MSEIPGEFAQTFCDILINISRGELDEADALLDKQLNNHETNTPCENIAENLKTLISQLREGVKFASALSEGDLLYEAPRNFYLFSDYKQLQANLRHLTWQAQQIAKGDYSQNVNFIGEFSAAFNQMIEGLRAARKTQEQLKELYATRDKFFSIISHDLRSPFNAILGFADILNEEWEELTDTERKTFLQNIRNTSHNTFDLLERLLEWSRVQTGKMKIIPTRVNLGNLVRENFKLLAPTAEGKFIHLVSEVAEEFTAWGDKVAILLVLRNLINNAIKFTRHGGLITVSAAAMHKLVVVTVSDTGVGISAENMNKLFRFEEQLKTEGTDKERGSGLGLVLCREIIDKSGGRIWAESIEGEGSRFSFTLPLNAPTQDKP